MKVSFMTFACPQWRLPRVVDAAVGHGYHGIEFRTDAQHAHGIEVTSGKSQRDEARKRCRGSGIEICCLATSLQFATDHVIADAPARIELAADLECPALRVFCGPIPEGFTIEQTIEKVAAQLRQVAAVAADHNVQLWLETHDTFSLGAYAGRAVRLADHPSVGINYDNMHPFRNGESLETTIAQLSPFIRHTHFHDSVSAPDQVVIKPLDTGELPMDDMMRALLSLGYTGYLSGEWFNTMYGSEPDESLAAYYRDMKTLVERNGGELAAV